MILVQIILYCSILLQIIYYSSNVTDTLPYVQLVLNIFKTFLHHTVRLFKSFCTLHYMFRPTFVIIVCLKVVGGNCCVPVLLVLIFNL
jgi:hypothetical protein